MSIGNALDDADKRAQKAAFALEQLQAMGFDLEDLLALRDSGQLPGQVTLHGYLPVVRKASKPGSRHVYASYWELLDVGLADLCACMCPVCVSTAAAGPGGAALPCPCRATSVCACTEAALAGGPDVTSCLDAYHGLGGRPLPDIVPTDIALAMAWAKLRANKRWARRNAKRAANGRATFNYKGRSAEEHTRSAASKIFSLVRLDPATGVKLNVALEVAKVRRPRSTARAYSVAQLEELWSTIFTCGIEDPELAMLVWWFHLETGARRGGALNLILGGLNLTTQMATLVEKAESVADQPISAELQRTLVGHALERGDVVVAVAEGATLGR